MKLFLAIFAALLAAHLCHHGVLWTEEDLPLAAARQILLGKSLYSGIWFDKPPLVPMVYLLWGAASGIVNRIAGAIYYTLVSWLAYRVAKAFWGEREGRWAAGLMAFFLTFDTASAVLPLAADSLLLGPHLLAIWMAVTGRALWSGVAAGIGFLCNAKAMFVAAACVAFAGPLVVAGFALPCAVAAGWMAASGSWSAYVDQVWVWPSAYARNTFLEHPVLNGLQRTLNWCGFHVSLVAGAVWAGTDRETSRLRWLRIGAWALLSLAGVALGWRFFPRYYFQLLPVAVVVASRGMVLLGRRWWILALLLLIPLVRFGPRYAVLAYAGESGWSDLAMDRESQDAAAMVNRLKRPGDTLYVWGYRPDLFIYTGLPAASRYLDCQAITGVPADRHLTQSAAVIDTAMARAELAASSPSFIVDGLSEYNHELALSGIPELRAWMSGYREVARVRGVVIYQRR